MPVGGLAFSLVPLLTSFLAEQVLGLGDDAVDTEALAIGVGDQLGPLPSVRQFAGLEHTHETPLLSDGDGSCKLYFRMVRETIEQQV